MGQHGRVGVAFLQNAVAAAGGAARHGVRHGAVYGYYHGGLNCIVRRRPLTTEAAAYRVLHHSTTGSLPNPARCFFVATQTSNTPIPADNVVEDQHDQSACTLVCFPPPTQPIAKATPILPQAAQEQGGGGGGATAANTAACPHPYACKGFSFSDTGLISQLYEPETKTLVFLLGTSHYSEESSDHVKEAIYRVQPDLILVEQPPEELTSAQQYVARTVIPKGHPHYRPGETQVRKELREMSTSTALQVAMLEKIRVAPLDVPSHLLQMRLKQELTTAEYLAWRGARVYHVLILPAAFAVIFAIEPLMPMFSAIYSSVESLMLLGASGVAALFGWRNMASRLRWRRVRKSEEKRTMQEDRQREANDAATRGAALTVREQQAEATHMSGKVLGMRRRKRPRHSAAHIMGTATDRSPPLFELFRARRYGRHGFLRVMMDWRDDCMTATLESFAKGHLRGPIHGPYESVQDADQLRSKDDAPIKLSKKQQAEKKKAWADELKRREAIYEAQQKVDELKRREWNEQEGVNAGSAKEVEENDGTVVDKPPKRKKSHKGYARGVGPRRILAIVGADHMWGIERRWNGLDVLGRIPGEPGFEERNSQSGTYGGGMRFLAEAAAEKARNQAGQRVPEMQYGANDASSIDMDPWNVSREKKDDV